LEKDKNGFRIGKSFKILPRRKYLTFLQETLKLFAGFYTGTLFFPVPGSLNKKKGDEECYLKLGILFPHFCPTNPEHGSSFTEHI
jgi:hypothetical protein